MNEARLREDICRFGRSLFERGLTPGSSGNISLRLDDGGWLVTPTNASLGFLDPARISRLDADRRLVGGDAPTKEIPLHAALYETRTAARAVVHLHSTHSVAVSMLPDIDPRAALRQPCQHGGITLGDKLNSMTAKRHLNAGFKMGSRQAEGVAVPLLQGGEVMGVTNVR